MMVTLACKREIKWESNDDISGSNTKEMCFGPAFSQKLLIVVIVVGVEHNSNINTAKLLKLFEQFIDVKNFMFNFTIFIYFINANLDFSEGELIV